LEEGKVWVKWDADEEGTLRLTVDQFKNLHAQLENINTALASKSTMENQNIGDSLYVRVAFYSESEVCVVIENVAEHDFLPSKEINSEEIDMKMKLRTWNEIPWFEINEYILELQECRARKTPRGEMR
jgi:hypothetical protein